VIEPVSSATILAKLWRVWCRWTCPTPAARAYRFKFLTKACEVRAAPGLPARSWRVHNGESVFRAPDRPDEDR
jgi:hypothetical protein